MSQTFKGESTEANPLAPTAPRDSMIASARAPQSDFYARSSAEACLTNLALRLGSDSSPTEVTEEALAALMALLPECRVEVREHASTSDASTRETSALQAASADDPRTIQDSAVRSLGRCEWPLSAEPDGPVLSIALQQVRQPREVARVLEIGERVAILLGAALRREAMRARLLTQSKELLELRDRMIQVEKLAGYGQLVASILHDLNNPLTAILAYTEYLHRTLGGAGVSSADLERLSRIREAAEMVLRQTRGLVEYSCPPRSPISSVDIGGILRRAFALCEHELNRANVTVQMNIEGSLPSVDGHADQLAQLFVNLFTNAAHAARPKDGRVDVAARVTPDDEWLRIEVHDNGRGIDPIDLGHVFDPFYTTRAGSGSGLGLSIVRDIAERHGGHVDVESVPHVGTTFVLSLPLSRSNAARRLMNGD